jgi:hypothetical protein
MKQEQKGKEEMRGDDMGKNGEARPQRSSLTWYEIYFILGKVGRDLTVLNKAWSNLIHMITATSLLLLCRSGSDKAKKVD